MLFQNDGKFILVLQIISDIVAIIFPAGSSYDEVKTKRKHKSGATMAGTRIRE
jgi:hypothetical protein